jgi:hypothetical protein
MSQTDSEIYINNFNNINDIILHEDYLIDNYIRENEVIWEIDRNHSNYEILNSLQNTHYNYDAFNIHFNENVDIMDDDFIPFEPELELELEPVVINEPITITVEEFPTLEEDKNCCICIESREISQICQLNCCHKFCYECILIHTRRNIRNPCCPLCRTSITNITVQHEEMRN